MKRLVLCLLFSFLSVAAFSQEICNNGKDDDFDGFIDCYDGDCAANVACDGIFLGNDATCQTVPPVFPAFTMTEDYHSDPETTNHQSQIVIGDLDRDGIPEIATMNRFTRKLFVLNGNGGSIKYEKSVAAGQPNEFEPYWGVGIANLDNDACAEIFFIGYYDLSGSSNDGLYLTAYDCQLNFLWRTAQKLPSSTTYGVASFGIADFDGDGLEEIYCKDIIFDAKTGIRIVASTAADFNKINAAPVAVNIVDELGVPVKPTSTDDKKLELVIGLAIYKVNLGTRAADVGSLTLISKRNEYFIRNEYNATSVADYNLDEYLDVIATGSTGSNGANTTVFFWDVKAGALKTYKDGTSSYGANGWTNGTGRLNIADLDGNGKMNVSYVSGKYLYALDETFGATPGTGYFWRTVINEETSGYTGCTLFDFNGDGKAEIVYRDERYLYILNGTNGAVLGSPVACNSRTNFEYPIVADVDADGSTELCVTCTVSTIANADFSTFVDINNLSALKLPGQVRVYKSAAEPWVPARRVWNQHGYFVVNVNDDLTIPTVVQAHQSVFSTTGCLTGPPVPSRPLNKFLNQSPFLNSSGCPTYASSDIAFSIAPTIIPPTCPNLNFTVSFVVTNLGDVSLTGNIPVSFYTTNPKKAGSTLLNTIFMNVNKLKKGDVFAVTNATVTGIGSDSLYVVLNDAGTTVPTPIKLPNTSFFECDYDNIKGIKINPLPAPLTGLVVNASESCAAPSNGAVRAFVPISGGGENTADYNFYWSNGAVAKPIASSDFVGPIYSGVPAGTYTVFARHKTANCGTAAVQVVVGSVPSVLPAVTVTALSNQTTCSPANGKLEATIAGGGAGYTIDWYDIALNPLGITGATASNLAAGSYLVIITKGTCNKSSAPATITGPQIADAQGKVLLNVVDCSNPNSGAIQADAFVSGVVQNPANYTFDWYYYNLGTSTRGSILPPANGTGQARSGLPVGSYQALVKDNATGCVSTAPPITVSSSTVIPTAQITQLAPQTSCDPANPNGILQGDILIGGVVQNPAGFTYQWFKGQNTLPANLVSTVSGTNGQIVNKVVGGGIPYTLKVTTSLNCSATIDFTIAETLTKPVVTLSPTNNGVCNPALASGTYTGAVAASVTFGGSPVTDFTNYSFSWHTGTLASDPAPSPNSTTSNLTQQNGGQYTLVVNKTDVSCPSTAVTATISNVNALPVLTTGTTSSTNCAVGKENGVAQVLTVDGAGVGTVSNYSYQWHTGAGTATPITVGTNPTATAAKLDKVQGGAANNYTVLVTNTTSGCQKTATVLVSDAKVLPTITLAKVDNSICAPASNFNGKVTATVTNQGANPLTDYTFAFGAGMGAGTQLASPNHNQYTKLNGGATAYTTTATHTPTGCTSSVASIVVPNTQVLPTITSTVVGSTNCVGGTANGSMAVTGVVPADTYSYRWFDKTNTLIAGQTAATLSGKQGGAAEVYTVEVTLSSTGCLKTDSKTIPDSKVLPIIALAATDNSNCAPSSNFNGKVTATVTNQGANPITDYTFAFGAGMAAGTQLTSPNHNQYTKLNGGATAYTATTTHTPTNCVSSVVSIPVTNTQTLPTITTSVTGSTNCVGAAANGSMAVTGVVPADTYSYRWFDKTNTLIAGQTAATLSGKQGGAAEVYTVEVTLAASGCLKTDSKTIPDSKVLPIISLAPTDNTICAPSSNFDGKVVATVTNQGANPITDYTFAFGAGMGAGTQLTSPNHNQFTKLNGGAIAYTATTTHTPTNCVSAVVSAIVPNSQTLPTITTSVVGSTNCSGTGNGSMAVTGVVPVDTYSYRWFDKNNALIASQTAPTLSNRQGGAAEVYTVEVTLATTGCLKTASKTIPDSKALPTLTLTPQPNTICDPSKVTVGVAAFDGQVGAAIDPVGIYASSVPGDFTFVWNTGLTGVGANLLANRDVGTYSVTALHTATGCQSTSYGAQVTSAKTLPTISMDQTPSENCTGGSPDGIASVTNVLPSGGGRTYDYKWFNGSSTSGTAGPVTLGSSLTTNNYNNVQGGLSGSSLIEYTVEVTINQTGCVNTGTVGVADDSKVPILHPLTSTNNTLCTVAKNGQATVSVLNYRGSVVPVGSYGNFTFAWLGGGTQGPAQTVTAAPAGNYTLVVTNINDNCSSNPVTVTIANNIYTPQIDVADVDQTSCNPATPNGTLTATIDQTAIAGGTGIVAGYTFTWVDNVTTVAPPPANIVAPGNQLINLKGNQTYTVTALRSSTGCSGTQTIFLDEALVIPTVTVNVRDLVICAPPDGRLTANAPVPGVLANYDYFWYDGSDAASSTAVVALNNTGLVGTATTNVYDLLVPGDYTLVVRHKTTFCTSDMVISTIANNSVRVNPVAENTAIPAFCNTGGGILNGAVRLTPLTSFTALAATDQLTIGASIGLAVNSKVIIDRNAALNLPGGLIENQTYFVESINGAGTVFRLKPTLAGAAINLTSDGDGTVSDFITTTGVGGYTFNWYTGAPSGTVPADPINYFTNPPNFGPLTANPTNPNATYSGINDGLYTLEVTNNSTGCKSFISHTLPFVGSHAVIKISKTNSQVCSPPGADNGSVIIQIEDPAVGGPFVPDNYTVTLTQGASVIAGPFAAVVPSPPLPAAPIPFTVSSALAPGTYVVKVKQNYGSLCELTQDVIIGRDALPPVMDLTGPIISNDACILAAVNGKIDLNISQDPDDLTVATTYGVVMAPAVAGSGFPLAAQPVGNYSAIKLSPGTYTFTTTASTGCSSTKTYTVLDNPVRSQFSGGSVKVTDAEYCTPGTEASAKVIVEQLDIVGGGAENMADYQFKWTNLTTNTVVYNVLGNAANNGSGGDEFINVTTVPAGTVVAGPYSIVATKMTDVSATGGIGCASTPFTVNIASKTINPVITLTPLSNTSCDPTFFEGSIQADVITAVPFTASAATDRLTFIGHPLAVNDQVLITGSSLPGGLVSGTNYFVESIVSSDNTAGDVITLKPTIAGSLINLTSNGSGSISVVGTLYNYDWTVSGGAGQPSDIPGNDGIGDIQTNIDDGTYTLLATNQTTGCFSSLQTTLVRDTPPVFTVTATANNQTFCSPFNGSINGLQVFIDGIGGTESNFDYTWFKTNLAGAPIIDGLDDITYPVDDQLTLVTFPTIALDKYFVKAIRKAPVIAVEATLAAFAAASAGYTFNVGDDIKLSTGQAFKFNGPVKTNVVDYSATVVAGVGCESAAFRKDILDDTVNPKVTFATINSTSCDNNFDGRITVTATTPSTQPAVAASNYNFVWTSDPDGAGALYSATNSATNNTASPFATLNTDKIGALSATVSGQYSIRVTNFVNQCFTDATASVNKSSIPMSISSVTSTNVDLCSSANGSGTVVSVSETPGPGVTTNYTYTWDDDPLMASPFATNTVAPAGLTQSNLNIGTYYVKARRNAVVSPATAGVSGSFCETAAVPFVVLDKRVNPTVSFATISSTSCDNNFDGKITVTANTATGPGSGVGQTYNFVWTSDPDAAGVAYSATNSATNNTPSPFPTLNTDKIGAISATVAGQYGIRVTNFATQCFTDATVNITTSSIPMSISSVTSTNVDLCSSANGSGTVVSVSETPGPGVTTNYTYTWDDDPLMGSPFAFNTVAPAGLTQSTLNIGTYYVKARRNPVVSPATPGVSGSFCETATVPFVVLDRRVNPTVSFATISSTSCDNNFDGKITVTATTLSAQPAVAASNYNFVWTSDPDAAGALYSATNSATNNTPSPFATLNTDKIGAISATVAGQYAIRVTNFVNQCFTDATVNVTKSSIPMSISSVTSTNVDLCSSANGSGTVVSISETPGPGVTTNYTYTWDDDPLMASPFAINAVAPAGLTRSNLNIGTYYVKARRNAVVSPATAGVSGSFCETAAVPFVVLDKRVNPTVVATITPNTACDNNFDGRITLALSTSGPPGAAANYDISWPTIEPGSSVAAALNVGASYTTPVTDKIGTGTFVVRAINKTTLCSVDNEVVMTTNPQPLEILTASKTDQAICFADGSVTVTSLSLGTPANYTFNWFKNSPTGTALVDGANATIVTPLLDKNNFLTMGAATYFVTAKRAVLSPGSGCSTPPFSVEVKDTHTDPKIVFSSASPNSSCNVLQPNGIAIANASEQSGASTDNYSFVWTLNGGAIPGITTITNTSNSSTLGNSKEGTYDLTITNTSNTGCFTSSTLNLVLDQTRSTPNIIDVSSVDPVDCNPSGSATVTKVTLGSTTNSLLFPPNVPPSNDVTGPGLLSFNYEWYQGSFATSNQLPIGGPPFTVTPSINSLLAGSYFVIVHDPSTDCKSGPKEVVIKGDNIIYPVLDVVQTMKQVSCMITTGSAALAATADGQTDANANYGFTWFNNLTNTTPTYAATSTISNLLPGDYSVTVLDKTTACTVSAPYIVKDESKDFTPVVSVGGQARTLCIGQDGSVLARVMNADPAYPFPYNATTFTADLFFGATLTPSGAPDVPNMPLVSGFFTNFVQSGLAEGFYSVRITDNNTGCFGVATDEVRDERKYPVIAIEKISPITNCDPARPNGVAGVTADGTFVGFQFDWYEGAAVTGTPVYVGAEYGELKVAPQQYVIRATNVVSGCTTDAPATFDDGTVPIPAPNIDKLSDVTSCVISNGALSASVGPAKITKDYIFLWYDGTVETPTEDFEGEIYTDLSAGKYSVTATDRNTGCKSPLKTEDVLVKQEFPDFIFQVHSTTCDKNDGFATLVMISNVPIEQIEWANGTGPFLFGPNYSDAAAGTYTVTATSFLGCAVTKDVEIKPDIRPYNGISRNNDGRNEFFMIDCIQEFPDNVVKIFNRAGTLVYEAQGYDNSDTFFDGKSNKGISLMGVDLPDGTYYYIVDKRDGSKPLAGYLEIVN